MGWQERDYTWFPERGSRMELLRSFLPPRATTGLLIAHVVGVMGLLIARGWLGGGVIAEWSTLSAERPNPAALLLHPFASLDFFTLITILYAVGSLGGRIESMLGIRAVLLQYSLGNLFGGLGFLAIAAAGPELAAWPLALPAGGMAAWIATLTRRLPFESVMIFGWGVRLWKLGLFGLAVVIGAGVMAHGTGAIGWAAASMVGATIPAFLSAVEAGIFHRGRERRARSEPTVARRAPSAIPLDDRLPDEPLDDRPIEPDREIDEILAKISRSGMGSLSDEDRAALEHARQHRLKGPQGH